MGDVDERTEDATNLQGAPRGEERVPTLFFEALFPYRSTTDVDELIARYGGGKTGAECRVTPRTDAERAEITNVQRGYVCDLVCALRAAREREKNADTFGTDVRRFLRRLPGDPTVKLSLTHKYDGVRITVEGAGPPFDGSYEGTTFERALRFHVEFVRSGAARLRDRVLNVLDAWDRGE